MECQYPTCTKKATVLAHPPQSAIERVAELEPPAAVGYCFDHQHFHEIDTSGPNGYNVSAYVEEDARAFYDIGRAVTHAEDAVEWWERTQHGRS